MDTRQALDIKEAIIVLSEALDMEFLEVVQNVCFLDKRRGAVLVEASKLWNEFEDAGIVERGAMLGLEITTNQESA